MAGIIVVAYQEWLVGMPRLMLLVIRSLFLFTLTFEVLKKGVYLSVITRRLNALQKCFLLKEEEKVDEWCVVIHTTFITQN